MSEHNPKYVEALKRGKVDYSTVPWPAIVGIAQAMMEGAGKYGRFNYRQDKIEARTYIAAILRHLLGDPSTGSVGWVNGEDTDEESGLHHLHKVMACCALVIDAQDHGMLIDNRLETESLTPPSARDTCDDGEDPATHFGGDYQRDISSTPKSNYQIYQEIAYDIALVDNEIEAREQYLKDLAEVDTVAFPGAYVEFRDDSPGDVPHIWTSVVGPFANERAAEEYAQLNPEKFAGQRTIFTI